MATPSVKLPLIYSCSGCSSAAQMANHIAVTLDRRGIAEMSCIAGLGGDVKSLVKLAQSKRPVIAVDGCPLLCVRNTLCRHAVAPDIHVVLSNLGVKKRFHMDFDTAESERIATRLTNQIAAMSKENDDSR
ncbi:putative zinc-binding protein [Dongia sp.]|uniref:putative zinc-binding protein n=1 Tax=Dongia sp. TaxID=1977262 RepID=UPI0035B0BE6A